MKDCCRKGCKKSKCIDRANSLWLELHGAGDKTRGTKRKKKKGKTKAKHGA